MQWIQKHPRANEDHLGHIPDFLSEDDPQSAKEQIHKNYSHGGGWVAMKGFEMDPDGSLLYRGDPPTLLLYEAKLRDEAIRVYQHAWVAIVQSDGTFEVARLD